MADPMGRGTKPADVASPVPNAAAAKAAADFMANYKPAQEAPPQGNAAGAAAAAEYAKSMNISQNMPDVSNEAIQNAAGLPSSIPEAMDMGKQVLGTAARAVDYPAGVARTLGYGAVSPIATFADGGKEIVTKEDLKNAFKGEAPKSEAYLERLGVPELGSIDMPLFGKVTGRGVVGFVSDILTDPLPQIAKLAKTYPVIGKLLEGPNGVTEAIGRNVYKSALRQVDQKVAERAGLEGTESTPVANVLLDGVKLPDGRVIGGGAPVGSTARLADKVDQISETLGSVRNELYTKADGLGVKIDMQFPFKNAEDVIAKTMKDRGLAPQAEALQEILDRYKQPGSVSLAELSTMKTNLYKAVPKSAWANTPGMYSLMSEFKMALANDFKKAIIDAGNTAEKGLGDAVNTINERWGPLLDARKPLNSLAVKSVPHGDIADKAILSVAGLHKFAIKKGLDLAATASGRTAIGKAIMFAGQHDIANRAFVNTFRPSPLQPPPPEQPE